jgi:preprotein translocase subunit Sss1
MKRITVEMLKTRKACSDQVELFERVFPQGAPVSMRSFAKARKAGLDTRWTAHLLGGPALVEYKKVRDPAWAEYKKVRDPAWAEYEKARDAAWAEYEKARAPAWVEYKKARDAAWAEYEKARAPAWVEYEKVCDAALVAALRGEEER